MRSKLLILSAALIILSLILSGCRRAQKDPNEIINFLKNLDSYSTEYTMETKNDRQVITQEGKQFYNKDLGYRMELGQDRVFIYKADKIYVNDVKNNLKYTTDKNFDNMYKISFIKEYIKLLYTNEEIKYDYKELDGKKYQLVELLIPGGSREMNKAVMYIDTKTCHPEQILVYDEKGKERIKISYKNFQTDPDLNADLFKVE